MFETQKQENECFLQLVRLVEVVFMPVPWAPLRVKNAVNWVEENTTVCAMHADEVP